MTGSHCRVSSTPHLSIKMSESISMGQLFDQSTNHPALEDVKKIIADYFPPGWREWQVLNAITQPLELDTALKNKVRFALPTVRLLEVFYPDSPYISERRFKEIKGFLSSWPLARALIFPPSNLSIQLRGSEERHRQFSLRSLLISRSEANKIRGTLAEDGSSNSSVTLSKPEIPSPPVEPLTPTRRIRGNDQQPNGTNEVDIRMTAIEKSVAGMHEEMKKMFSPLQTAACPQPRHPAPLRLPLMKLLSFLRMMFKLFYRRQIHGPFNPPILRGLPLKP
ncbi:hypothetical protein M8J77_004156 [Diaphorina citri]|nr:hypothetical protein M8J77_004156 [Diaphorina citri]